jgi:hypothetical protein
MTPMTSAAIKCLKSFAVADKTKYTKSEFHVDSSLSKLGISSRGRRYDLPKNGDFLLKLLPFLIKSWLQTK